MCEHDKQFEKLHKDIEVLRKAVVHQEPSARTLLLFDELKTENENIIAEMKTVRENEDKEHARLNRVIFGERDIDGIVIEVGMHRMLIDIHTKFVQANGVVGFFKMLGLVGGVSAMLYAFFKKI